MVGGHRVPIQRASDPSRQVGGGHAPSLLAGCDVQVDPVCPPRVAIASSAQRTFLQVTDYGLLRAGSANSDTRVEWYRWGIHIRRSPLVFGAAISGSAERMLSRTGPEVAVTSDSRTDASEAQFAATPPSGTIFIHSLSPYGQAKARCISIRSGRIPVPARARSVGAGSGSRRRSPGDGLTARAVN
jgi:hypothetical protein